MVSLAAGMAIQIGPWRCWRRGAQRNRRNTRLLPAKSHRRGVHWGCNIQRGVVATFLRWVHPHLPAARARFTHQLGQVANTNWVREPASTTLISARRRRRRSCSARALLLLPALEEIGGATQISWCVSAAEEECRLICVCVCSRRAKIASWKICCWWGLICRRRLVHALLNSERWCRRHLGVLSYACWRFFHGCCWFKCGSNYFYLAFFVTIRASGFTVKETNKISKNKNVFGRSLLTHSI